MVKYKKVNLTHKEITDICIALSEMWNLKEITSKDKTGKWDLFDKLNEAYWRGKVYGKS